MRRFPFIRSVRISFTFLLILTLSTVLFVLLKMDLVDTASIVNVTNVDTVIGVTPAAKVLIITWTLIVIIVGIGGNGLVLLGSIKYQALRMDRISIFLLECVAVTDMLLAGFDFISTLVTEIANEWVLGDSYCFFITVFTYIAYSIEVKLILTIAVYRCWMMTFPFGFTLELTLGKRILFFAGIAGLESCVTAAVIFVNKYRAFFNPYIFSCDIDFSGEKTSMIVALWSIIIPGLFIITSNVFLLIKACKMSREKLKKRAMKGLTTVMVLCWAFILSYGFFCAMIVLGFTARGPPGWIFCLQNLALGLNLFVNPLIYHLYQQQVLWLHEINDWDGVTVW